MHDDQLRDGLDLAADQIDVGDPDSALVGVHATRRRRRRRRTAFAGVGVTALLIGGVATFVTLDDSEGDEVLRSASSSTTSPATTVAAAPATNVAQPDDQTDDTPADTAGAEASAVVDGQSVSVPSFGDDGGSGFAEWLVPWKDGFLAGGTVYQPQLLPAELPPEIVELFPPEVVELFADGLPGTIDEATSMLSEAGLLDEVTTVISEHPEASEAIYSSQAVPPQGIVQFTTEGDEWSPVDVTFPDGVSGLHQVTVGGDRLVVVDAPQGPSSTSVVVASTTDLSNWETQTIDVPRPADLPEEVRFNVWPSNVAANESGWVLSLNVSAFIDFEQLLPDEVAELFQSQGGGVATQDDGIQIEVMSADGGGEVESYEYTWAELGVADDIGQYINGPGSSELWAAPFGGAAAKSDIDLMFVNNVAATPGRFVVAGPEFLTSTDGIAWTEVEAPEEAGFATALAAADDGIVVFAGAPGGQGGAYLVDESLTEWARVEIPGAPDNLAMVLGNNPLAPAIIVDASPPRFVEQSIDFEADGFRLTQNNSGSLTAYELVVIATGEVVLSESVDLQTLGRDEYFETGPFDHLQYSTDQSGITIVDPTSGDVMVVISQEVVDQAYDEAFSHMSAETEEYRPDLWLIAYAGGNEWLVDDLSDAGDVSAGYYGPSITAVNGDTLLVAVTDGWMRYNLGG